MANISAHTASLPELEPRFKIAQLPLRSLPRYLLYSYIIGTSWSPLPLHAAARIPFCLPQSLLGFRKLKEKGVVFTAKAAGLFMPVLSDGLANRRSLVLLFCNIKEDNMHVTLGFICPKYPTEPERLQRPASFLIRKDFSVRILLVYQPQSETFCKSERKGNFICSPAVFSVFGVDLVLSSCSSVSFTCHLFCFLTLFYPFLSFFPSHLCYVIRLSGIVCTMDSILDWIFVILVGY